MIKKDSMFYTNRKKSFMTQEDFKFHDQRPVFTIVDSSADGGVPLLKFRLLEQFPMLTHGITTRVGGVSQGMYGTLNVSYTRGDDQSAVDENFLRTAISLDASLSDFVLTDQTHTTNIRAVTRADCGKGIIRERDYKEIDGLITNEPGIVLSAFFADCVPLLLVDPVRHAIGLSHSGWRGTVARMGRETVRAMQENYGSRPQDLYAAIGPSICQSCYEVSEDVAERFCDEFPQQANTLCEPVPGVIGKFQLDLWKANEIVLKEAGILQEHLAVTNLCTCCNPRLLFSHRASNGRRGNFGAFMKLNPPKIL